MTTALHLIASYSLCEHGQLLVSPLDFLLVVSVLVFEDEHFLQALIFDLFVMHEQVLQLLIHLVSFSLPATLFCGLLLSQFLDFILCDALLSL